MTSQPTDTIAPADPAAAHPPPRLAGRGAWLAPLALLVLTAGMCLYGLGGGARFEPIDCWVAQTAREMHAAGEWLVPRFSGEIRLQKSPGPYWAVMLAALVRGRVDEVSARLPSVAAALVLVATIWWLTRHIAGPRAALFAGCATASSVLVLWWSHRAASDLGLAACTTVALAAAWVGSECAPAGRRRVALWLLAYLAAGLGMLYKLPMPLAVVGLPIAVYLLVARRWGLLRSGWHLVGLALFLLPWLPWAVAANLAAGPAALGKWKVEFLDRFTGDLPNVEGQSDFADLFTYLGPVVLYCLPFSLSLPAALGRAFRRQPGVNRAGTLFMLIWFASLLVFFTAAAGKEWRYFLPGLPPLFVLLGIELARLFDPHRRPTPRRDLAALVAVWVLVPAALAGGGVALWVWWERRGRLELEGLHTWGDILAAYAVLGVILVLGFGLAAWCYRRRREHVAFVALVGTMWAAWLWCWPMLLPKLGSQRPFIEFARDLRQHLADTPQVALFSAGTLDARIIWYGDFRIPRLIDQLKLLEEQHYRRDMQYELRRYGQEMVARLAGDEPVLLLAAIQDYALFLKEAPAALRREGRSMPPHHLWLQTRYGDLGRHYVVFGNRAPPYPEPALHIPDGTKPKIRQNLLEIVAAAAVPPPEAGGG